MLSQEMAKIWVLGSTSRRASKCIEWETPLPDFSLADVLIINLETLISASKENKSLEHELFKQALPKIFSMLMKEDKQVLVIIPTQLADVHWLPIYPDWISTEPTEIIKTSRDQAINFYLENVETTNYYFHAMKIAFKVEKNPGIIKAKKPPTSLKAQQSYITKLRRSNSIRNTAKQLVGGTFKINIKRRQCYLGTAINEEQYLSNPITFLPPPTKVSFNRAIDLLINAITKSNDNKYLHVVTTVH